MELLNFGIEVIAISASGVLAPGPLFFANLLHGTLKGTRSCLSIAFGHTLVEFTLVILLALGLFSMQGIAEEYANIIGLLGGISIVYFAAVQIIEVLNSKRNEVHSITTLGYNSPFAIGITLSGLNPFFLVWWFTAGLKLITDSMSFGFGIGIAILFVFHVWMDYAWLVGTAYFASKGKLLLLKSRYYSIVILALALVLAYYGIFFIFQALYHRA